MIGSFGDRNPEGPIFDLGEMTPENWIKFREARETAAKQIIQRVGAKFESHKVLVLVDLQGIYLSLHKWLSDQNFPIEGGLVLSRLAFFQLQNIFERIAAQVLESSNGLCTDFEDLLTNIKQHGIGGTVILKPEAIYVSVVPKFELFYAPAPLMDIKWKLKSQACSGSYDAKEQLKKIEAGILVHSYFERDYAAYDDFVAKLKANPESSQSEKGFFSFRVGEKGLERFDEKEVDCRIVIRAMDAFHNYEADSLCIVSSDQDFLPLHDRAREFGIRYYQADVAKFSTESYAARKLRDLGSNFLLGEFDPTWPSRIIVEACAQVNEGIPAMYTLRENELPALCKMHNSMNEVHISAHYLSDGTATLKWYKPAE